MTLALFRQDPWKRSHPLYASSSLTVSPAPEYASSEVLMASLYRAIGYEDISEGKVPQAGRELEQRLQKLRDKRGKAPQDATIGVEDWNAVLHGVLESPKLPNQSAKRFLQVTPVVPSLAAFSGSARLAGNPWTPGNLLRRIVWLGSPNRESAGTRWTALFQALSVNDQDDIFARWLEQESRAWATTAPWQEAPVREGDIATLAHDDFDHLGFMPARQFAKDLDALIQAKHALTRRQWTSLVESVVRLAAVSHVAWLCEVQARIWRCLSDALAGAGPTEVTDTRSAIFPERAEYMAYGGKALPGLKDMASSYLAARLGINTVLWSLVEVGHPYDGDVSSSAGIAKLCQHLRQHREVLNGAGVMATLVDIREQEARALNCKKGIGANLLEFARHALGKRQTAMQLLQGYDQGYILRKKGNSNSSPWIVALGPVAVLALVHCALTGVGGPRSVHRLGQHLAAYGVVVDHWDIGRNDLGLQLRMLGLVLDSPDAESGMLLIPPFPSTNALDKQS